MKRRVFVKGSLAASTLAVAAGAGLLSPTRVLAAAWPENAFGQRPEADALNAFFGTSEVTESDQVALKAPLQAENGAVVPIKVMTTLPNVESIAVVVEKNPAPFTTGLEVMGGGAGAALSSSPPTASEASGATVAGAGAGVTITTTGTGAPGPQPSIGSSSAPQPAAMRAAPAARATRVRMLIRSSARRRSRRAASSSRTCRRSSWAPRRSTRHPSAAATWRPCHRGS